MRQAEGAPDAADRGGATAPVALAHERRPPAGARPPASPRGCGRRARRSSRSAEPARAPRSSARPTGQRTPVRGEALAPLADRVGARRPRRPPQRSVTPLGATQDDPRPSANLARARQRQREPAQVGDTFAASSHHDRRRATPYGTAAVRPPRDRSVRSSGVGTRPEGGRWSLARCSPSTRHGRCREAGAAPITWARAWPGSPARAQLLAERVLEQPDDLRRPRAAAELLAGPDEGLLDQARRAPAARRARGPCRARSPGPCRRGPW